MKYAFLSFAYGAKDANFVRFLTVSLLLSFWGLQLMESDTLLSPTSVRGLEQKDFDVDVRPEHVFYLDLLFKLSVFLKQGCTTQPSISFSASKSYFGNIE